MNDPTFGKLALPDTERSVTGPFSGSSQNLGAVLSVNPIIAIFDNQSTVDIQVYIGSVLWKTFQAGEGLVLDLRGNHGITDTYTLSIGTQIAIIGTGGTGSFRLSILYAD